MRDIEGIQERAGHTNCQRCNADLHFCPGCGEDISHTQQTQVGACEKCDDDTKDVL